MSTVRLAAACHHAQFHVFLGTRTVRMRSLSRFEVCDSALTKYVGLTRARVVLRDWLRGWECLLPANPSGCWASKLQVWGDSASCCSSHAVLLAGAHGSASSSALATCARGQGPEAMSGAL